MSRHKGEGSIYQRADGRWVAAIKVNGRKYSRYAATSAEAVEQLHQLRVEHGGGLLVDPSNLTVTEYFDAWLSVVGPRLRPSTLHSYRTILRCHIVPEIGSVKLQRLQAGTLARLYAAKQKGGLSPRRVQMIHRLLHKALADAHKWRYVGRNVADDVEAPSPAQSELTLWTLEQSRLFLRACLGGVHAHDLLFAFLLVSGLRLGEALGLTWDDVDWETEAVQVRRQVTRIDNRPVEGRPKTDAGTRVVSVARLGTDILRSLHARRQALVMGSRAVSKSGSAARADPRA